MTYVILGVTNGQEEQCKLDCKPQALEYKKVTKPPSNNSWRDSQRVDTAGPVVATATVAATMSDDSTKQYFHPSNGEE